MRAYWLLLSLVLCSCVSTTKEIITVEEQERRASIATETEKACNNGDMVKCSNLGVMYLAGRGVKGNPKKAAELYQKACNAGEKVGCLNLAPLYAHGIGVEKDTKKAFEMYLLLCAQKIEEACKVIEKFKKKPKTNIENP